jgi:hypothetical protein
MKKTGRIKDVVEVCCEGSFSSLIFFRYQVTSPCNFLKINFDT